MYFLRDAVIERGGGAGYDTGIEGRKRKGEDGTRRSRSQTGRGIEETYAV